MNTLNNTTTETTNLSATDVIQAFSDFCMNFNHDFIDEAFAEIPSYLKDHLKSKWVYCYEKHGAFAAMLSFHRELSIDNRKILVEYIINR